MGKKKKILNSIAKSAAVLSIITVFIKAVGFMKQAVISYYFGTSVEMDSYLIITDFVSEVGMMLKKKIPREKMNSYQMRLQGWLFFLLY